MKKTKAQWKQLTRQILALGLAVVLVSGMTDFSVLAEDAEKPTVTSEGTVAEKKAENPVEEDTEVETTSGNTVAVLKSKVQEAEPEDDEAGLAVQAEDDTTGSDLIEVTINSTAQNYKTFTDAMNAVTKALESRDCKVKIKLLADVKDVTSVSFNPYYIYSNANISVDLNGHTLGSEPKTFNEKYMRFRYCTVTLEDSSKNSEGMSYMYICIDNEDSIVTVQNGNYRLIGISYGTGFFKGGRVETIEVSGDKANCTVTNGEYGSISISDASTLEISGENTTVDSLSVSTKTTATVTGGTYGSISNGSYGENSNLSNIVRDPYVLISTHENSKDEIVDKSGKSARYVKVAQVPGDRIAPTWTADGGIQVKDIWYNSLQDKVDFTTHVYNDSVLNLAFHANDEDGIKRYCYYLQEVDDWKIADFVPLTETDLNSLRDGGKFSPVEVGNSDIITKSLDMKSSNNYTIVVYAYAVDKKGNRSGYVCTDGILIDNVIPTIKTDYNKYTIGTTEATIPFKISEDATLVYFSYDQSMAKKAGYADYYALYADVKKYVNTSYSAYDNGGNTFYPFVKKQGDTWVPAVSDGENIAITDNVTVPLHVVAVKAGQNQITLSGLTPGSKTGVMLQAIDKAGNLLNLRNLPAETMKCCKYMSFTTEQLTPEITVQPSVTGVYGTRMGLMTIKTDGIVKYNGEVIKGVWAWTSENEWEIPEVGTQLTCGLVFKPDASYDNKYKEIEIKVVPVVQPKPITITITNGELTKIYGEKLPAITTKDFEILNQNGESPLVSNDTKETIAKSLSYDTEAAEKTADVGTYDFTVKSNSRNYNITVQYPNDATHGTVEVQQAKGEIKKVSGTYKDRVGIEYQKDKEFNISGWVVANYPDAKFSYEIENSTANIITVTSEGIVKVHNAGTADILISLPESKNYTAADQPFRIMVVVKPKKITIDSITKNYLYTQGTNEDYEEISIMSMASLFPEDYGSIWTSYPPDLTITDSNNIFDGTPEIIGQGADAVIRYKVKENAGLGNTAQITLSYISTTNYTVDGGVTINVVLVDRTPTELQGDLALKNSTLTYGQALSAVQFGNNTFVDKTTKKTVPGTLEWSTPNATPDAGTYQAEWKFTPKDIDTYIGCTGKVTITVNKADPSEVTVPELDGAGYGYRPTALGDYVLNEIGYVAKQGMVKGIHGETLDGTWSWVEQNFVPEIGTHSLKIRFTPTSPNYNSVEREITLNVHKASISIFEKPSVEPYTHGDYLYSQVPKNGKAGYYNHNREFVELEGTFSWYQEPNVRLSYLENLNSDKTYGVVFTPKDQAHYHRCAEMISIVVNQAEYPSNKPGDLNVKNSCKTLKDVLLPDGWVFVVDDPSKLDGELEIDTPISAEVKYQGEDRDNYINTNVTITVTRSSCDHEKTERREIVKATCIAEGNTGYLWCLDCNTKLEEGTVTPKDPTNHTALTSKVIKQPTTSEEGIMEYTCSACGYSATKAIAKITSTSSDTGSSSGSQSNNDDKPTPTPTPTPVATPVPAVTPVRPNRIPVKPTVKEEPKTPAPFLRGENGKEGWAVITETVTEAEDGDTVIVDMNGSSVVQGDVFDRIRGKDITVEFDLGNGILWKVNGQSVEKGNVGDIDFTVRAGEDANDTIPLEIINNLTGERTYMNLTLAYEGEFGFEAVLSLNVGTANAGLYANLFYYNEATKELEFLCAGEIGQDGGAELTFTHASEYTIVIDEQPMETEQSQEVTAEIGVQDNQEDNTVNIAPEVENTGHTALMIFCIILIVAAFIVIGVIVFVKKNKKEE